MMTEPDFEKTISAIYRAAADVKVWPEALCQLADAFGVSGATLGAQGLRPAECFAIAGRIDPEAIALYIDHFHSVNPIWSRVPRTKTGTIQTDAMVMPRSEFVATEFYNDFMLKIETIAMLNGVTMLHEGRQTVVTLQSRREFTQQDVQLFHRFMPHLQAAVELNHKISKLEINQNASVLMLECIDQAALLLDSSGHLILANSAAERHLAAGAGLSTHKRVLRATRAGDTRLLHSLIVSCARRGFDTGAGGLMSVQRGQDRKPLTLQIMPLHGSLSPFSSHHHVVVFISDPEAMPRPMRRSIKHEFGLTAAETAVATEIMLGDGIQAAADRLGISRATVRTHLARIFDKTGKRRQTELIGLLTQMSRFN